MALVPVPEQGFQNFSAPTPAPKLAIFLFLAPTSGPFVLNFAGSGSLQLCSKLKFAINHYFCVPKMYFDHCKTKKLAF